MWQHNPPGIEFYSPSRLYMPSAIQTIETQLCGLETSHGSDRLSKNLEAYSQHSRKVQPFTFSCLWLMAATLYSLLQSCCTFNAEYLEVRTLLFNQSLILLANIQVILLFQTGLTSAAARAACSAASSRVFWMPWLWRTSFWASWTSPSFLNRRRIKGDSSGYSSAAKRTGAVARPLLKSFKAGFPIIADVLVKSITSSTNCAPRKLSSLDQSQSKTVRLSEAVIEAC